MKVNKQIIFVILIFVAGAVAGLVVVGLGSAPSALVNIIMFFVGLFGMAAVSALHRLVDRDGPLVQITFNEAGVRRKLDAISKELPADVLDAEIVEERERTWDVRNEDYLGASNHLALAKLRIDLESELRAIARDVGLSEYASRTSVRSLASALAQNEHIPVRYLSVLEDILPTLNKAVHGQDVTTDTAASILRAGNDLLLMIRVLRRARRGGV
jgi:hypothetical protein